MVTFRHDRVGTPASAWREHPARAHVPALAGIDTEHLDRVVVLAAHPDDESLGAGGLTASCHDLGLAVQVVVATDGEGSHPASPTHPPARLAQRRRTEARLATGLLAPGTTPLLLGLPDGGLAAQVAQLTTRLVDLLGDARRTLLVAPWRHDGHPDHEAAGAAAAAAARRTGARLVEYPVWWWHWADPADADWTTLRSWTAGGDADRRRAEAVSAHATQVAALSTLPGDEALLGPDLLAHFSGPQELLVEQPAHDPALDDLHAAHDEPWGVDRRWYEQRKRALLLAALPRPRFRRALEVGCSTGVLSAALAERSDELLALDASPHAVRRAVLRLEHLPHATARVADLPRQWPQVPQGDLDLVVISEVGYFLSPVDLEDLLARVTAALAEDGVVVLCHWRHPVEGWLLDGPAVHERAAGAGLGTAVARYADRDVELVVWSRGDVLPAPGG